MQYTLWRGTDLHSTPISWMDIARGTAAEVIQALREDVGTPGGYGYPHKITDESGDNVQIDIVESEVVYDY